VNQETVFVFGSNLAGAHAGGAAQAALLDYGAQWGVGEGRTGQSYALPTMDAEFRPRSLIEISASVQRFVEYARTNPNLAFQVTKVGCGIAGFKETEIAPLFAGAPDNCLLPGGWRA
jgi:hypothetical protein